MAAQGSLADFNILNLLQMVKMEGKTGRLSLTDGDKMVKITMDAGSIIYAEAEPEKDESRIKNTLLVNGLITPAEWGAFKKEHDDKLRPYWEILGKNANTQKIALELLRRQTVDNVYEALRWKKGDYELTSMKSLKYNNKVMTPMDIDALLMEGFRIADELPGVTKGLHSDELFITKNIVGEDDSDKASAEAVKITGASWANSLEREILHARGVELRNSDVATLSVIGEGRSIKEVVHAARQGEYETRDALQRLKGSGVIRVGAKKKEESGVSASGMAGATLWLVAVAVLGAVVAAGGMWRYTIQEPAIQKNQAGALMGVRSIEAKVALKKIEKGLQVYYSYFKQVPSSLGELANRRIIAAADLVDPWGHPYQMEVKGQNYLLYSSGADRFLTKDDIYLNEPDAAPQKEEQTPANNAPGK